MRKSSIPCRSSNALCSTSACLLAGSQIALPSRRPCRLCILFQMQLPPGFSDAAASRAGRKIFTLCSAQMVAPSLMMGPTCTALGRGMLQYVRHFEGLTQHDASTAGCKTQVSRLCS